MFRNGEYLAPLFCLVLFSGHLFRRWQISLLGVCRLLWSRCGAECV